MLVGCQLCRWQSAYVTTVVLWCILAPEGTIKFRDLLWIILLEVKPHYNVVIFGMYWKTRIIKYLFQLTVLASFYDGYDRRTGQWNQILLLKLAFVLVCQERDSTWPSARLSANVQCLGYFTMSFSWVRESLCTGVCTSPFPVCRHPVVFNFPAWNKPAQVISADVPESECFYHDPPTPCLHRI